MPPTRLLFPGRQRAPRVGEQRRTRCRLAVRRGNHARRNRPVGLCVNQNKGAGAAVFFISIERDGPQQVHGHRADVVHVQRSRRLVIQRAQVGAVTDGGNEHRHRLAGVLQQIAAMQLKRPLIHPHQRGLRALRNRRRSLGRNNQIAAADIEFSIEHQRDGKRRNGFGQIAVPGNNALDSCASTRRQHGDRIAGTNGSRSNLPCKSAERVVRPQHALHRKSKRRSARVDRGRHGLQQLQQRWSLVPIHRIRFVNDVVALQRAHRHNDPLHRVAGIGRNLIQNGAEVRLDGAEGRFVVADQIHLVHRHQNVTHAQQRRNVSVTARLDQHSLAGVDQNHRRIGRRRAGCHISRVLLVAGRIGDDELAPRRGEIAVGNIDRDALFAFGAEPVRKQREIDLSRRGRSLSFNRAHLVFVDGLRIVKQPPDECGLSVVHTAGCREAQQVLLALLLQKLVNGECGSRQHRHLEISLPLLDLH